MDRHVTAQFFSVSVMEQGVPFETALANAAALAVPDRARTLGTGIRVRLEATETHGSLRLAELTRVQSENLPSEVRADGVGPLPIGELGHASSICYDTQSRVMVMHFAPFMSAARICEYLSHFADGAAYAPFPVLNQATLNQINAETPTKLHISVAKAARFDANPNAGASIAGNIKAMADAVEGHLVTVTISVGQTSDVLNKPGVMAAVRSFLGMQGGEVDVRSLKVKTLENEVPYDFIRQLLKVSEELNLPDRDPVLARRERFSHLRRSFATHQDYLRANYGPRNG